MTGGGSSVVSVARAFISRTAGQLPIGPKAIMIGSTLSHLATQHGADKVVLKQQRPDGGIGGVARPGPRVLERA